LWNLVVMKLMSLQSCRVSNLLIWTYVAYCDEFCILEKLSFQICALIHALATRGERKLEKTCIASLEPIPRVKGELVHFFCIFGFWEGVVCCSKSVWPILVTGLTDFGNRPDRFWEPVWPVLGTGLTGLCPRAGTRSGGVRICAGGVLVCISGLCSLLEHGFVSDVSSRCRCLRGPRLVFFKWSSLYLSQFSIACWSFFYSFLFFFLFYDYQMCVLSMHSSRGTLRTMCGLRTGGWSLSCVMSDWQCCVDWFLAMYWRCRLQLDLCWRRW
jgi:hypothetical protein